MHKLLLFFVLLYANSLSYSSDVILPQPASLSTTQIISNLQTHCVNVYLTTKTFDGTVSSAESFSSDMDNEHPSYIGGYWWDNGFIIIPDPVLPDVFIKEIEISRFDSEDKYPAEIAGRFVNFPAILLKVLPNSSGNLPESAPISFFPVPENADLSKFFTLEYQRTHNTWLLEKGAFFGGSSYLTNGQILFTPQNKGLVVNESGNIVGLSFHEKLSVSGKPFIWRSNDLHSSLLLSPSDYYLVQNNIESITKKFVFPVRLTLNSSIDDDSNFSASARFFSDSDIDEKTTEIMSVGYLFDTNKFLVPLKISSESIARIESIGIFLDDQNEIEADFVGAWKDFMVMVVKVDSAALPYLSTENNFFSCLDSSNIDKCKDLVSDIEGSLFFRWLRDYSLGSFKEYIDYDRGRGFFTGYTGISNVLTFTNEENSSLAFDSSGNLLAIALTPRFPPSNEDLFNIRQRNSASGFVPITTICDLLSLPSTVDVAIKPESISIGRKLISLGVEWQRLDSNTAKLFSAEKYTRGGQIGMLVTYVYPDSYAAQLGLLPNDILLSISASLWSEPVELKPLLEAKSSGFSFYDVEGVSQETLQQIIALMPPPWPNRENSLSLLLTAIGEGKEVIVNFLRNGELKQGKILLDHVDVYYRNAPRFKSNYLGITVKPITYEVERFFNRHNDNGVIVSKVLDGHRGSIAGMHNYLLITHINGELVKDLEDFKSKMASYEISSPGGYLELTIESFGKTRLINFGDR